MDRRWYVMRSVWLMSVQIGLLLWVSLTQAQTTSITSSGFGTKVTLNGGAPVPTYDITGGTRPGNGANLFHSFGDFSVGTHDIARFGNDSGLPTTNILSRVTGGQTSNIYGMIQTAGFGSAALWLINPAGIVFGPTASLNVGGSVHFSTADYLRLGSGNDRFYADLGKTSQLTSAPVTAFGFLGERPAGPITVQAGNPLAVSEGKAISLIGGDISITGRTLSAPGGQINLASVAGAGEVVPNQLGQAPVLSLAKVSQQGTIQLTEGAILRTSSTTGDGGPVFIRGGQLVMENAGIEAVTTAPRQFDFSFTVMTCCKGGIVDVVADSVLLKGSTGGAAGKTIYTNNQGDITFSTNELTLDNAKIVTDGYNVPVLDMNRTGHIRVQGLEGANSFANHVFLRNQTVLNTDGFFLDVGGGRPGGQISVQAIDIDISNTKILTNQGSISLDATKTIQSGGQNIIQNDSGFTINISDHKGIVLKAGDSIDLTRGDRVEDLTAGSIHGGTYQAPPISLLAPNISLKGTFIGVNGALFAEAGKVSLRGTDIEIADVSTISTTTSGGISAIGGGSAGSINISGLADGTSAKSIRILQGSKLTSEVPGANAFGTAGSIELDGQQVIFDGAQATASHAGSGRGGDITIHAAELILANNSRIGAVSTSTSAGAANAGNINITSTDSTRIANSTVSTSAIQASGGNITLNASNLIHLRNSKITTSVTGGTGSGGNISIDPQFVVLEHSQILAQATAGKGGAISLVAETLLIDPASVINADSKNQTLNGTVNIQAPIQQLSGAIAPLPQAFAVATNLYGQRCATQKGGQFSSFVEGARDGVPPQPGDLIPSPLLLESDGASPSLGLQSSTSLAAIRLGLPNLDQTPHSLTIVTGCRA